MKLTAAVATVACGLLLAGCGASGDVTAPAASSSTVASATSTAPSASPSVASVPSPSDEQRVALVTKLQAVDPGLVADADRAVSRARSTCERILTPADGTTTLNEYVQQEFEGGNVPDLTPEQADAIVAAVQASFCS